MLFIENDQIFWELFRADTEKSINTVMEKYKYIFKVNESWKPLGNQPNNYSVVQNQQSSPIAALIEKITNSIDAILMKKCYQNDIDPTSQNTPKTMTEAIKVFFEDEWQNWNLPSYRNKQAESIQIHADGPKGETSLIIYDDGEGQHPEDFEDTFLSLIRGNKNKVKFVQGKYNMGGTGALVFCGHNKYQLIASKKHDGTGKFGFTLIRKHPMSKNEEDEFKNTWFEYLVIDGKIPSFNIKELNLNLHNRTFTTGTIVKLYSYDLPSGSRSVISRDLNQSINEFLFEPALPIYTIDKKERYPKDRELKRGLYGLKRRLEEQENKYIQEYFSEELDKQGIGKFKVTCYIFKSKLSDQTVKETKATLQREFFKNNMYVLFSNNGQVQGHFTDEFYSRSLKFPLLKGYLLIHVDCTHMNREFNNELFMASRDRLNSGGKSQELRNALSEILRKGRLARIHKERKDTMSMDGTNASDLLKSFTKNLPLNNDLLKLINQTFSIEDVQKKDKKKNKPKKNKAKENEKEEFIPERFPSFFKINAKNDGKTPIAKIPLDGNKTISFFTDVENHFFDRSEEPGELEISLMNFKPNDTTGGKEVGEPKNISDAIDVEKSSPQDGIIKVSFSPNKELKVGDSIEVKVSLSSNSENFEEMFWIEIADKDKPKEKKEEEPKETPIGLPEFILVAEHKGDNIQNTWEDMEVAEFSYTTVMYPYVEGDSLEKIFINMDCKVLKEYKSKLSTLASIEMAEKRWISSVYFHTLFLYTISKNKKYEITKQEDDKDIELSEYLQDIFESYYASFLLNFEMNDLIQSLE